MPTFELLVLLDFEEYRSTSHATFVRYHPPLRVYKVFEMLIIVLHGCGKVDCWCHLLNEETIYPLSAL